MEQTFQVHESAVFRALVSAGLIIGTGACADLGLLPIGWLWAAVAFATMASWPEVRSR